jgi:mono/diheme cytochrome c family protein
MRNAETGGVMTTGRLIAAAALVLAGTAGGVRAEPYAYTIVDAARVPVPLGGIVGDAAQGETAFAAQCTECHAATALAGRDAAAIRLAVIDLSVMRPEAAGHAFYDPGADGRTLLRARTIEDIVTYLASRD